MSRLTNGMWLIPSTIKLRNPNSAEHVLVSISLITCPTFPSTRKNICMIVNTLFSTNLAMTPTTSSKSLITVLKLGLPPNTNVMNCVAVRPTTIINSSSSPLMYCTAMPSTSLAPCKMDASTSSAASSARDASRICHAIAAQKSNTISMAEYTVVMSNAP